MDYLVVLFIGMIVFILYIVLFGECEPTKSHRQIVAEYKSGKLKAGLYGCKEENGKEDILWQV